MKKILAIAAILIISGFSLFAQNPPPPPGDPSGGGNNPPVGGGASIGSGLVIMLALGAAYGGKKIYHLKKS